MALPTSGELSLSQVNTELGKAATSQIGMNDAAVRALAGVSSGAISISNLHGKSSVVPPTLSLSVSGNGQSFSTYGTKYAYINCSLGGTSPTTSCARISGSTEMALAKISNTQYRVGFSSYGSCSIFTTTYRVTASNSAGSVSRDASVTFYDFCDSGGCCFTGDSLVTMADGSRKRIDEVMPGDLVKTPFGFSEVDWIRLPKLADRPLLAMSGGKCKTSGEHNIWSKHPTTGEQWWATRDIERWAYERDYKLGPGLNGREPIDLIALGCERATYATEDGWEDTDWYVVEEATPDTQLYHLYLKDHASYFVDGFLVIGELPRMESLIDWSQFTWNPASPQPPVYMQYDYELEPVDKSAFASVHVEYKEIEE